MEPETRPIPISWGDYEISSTGDVWSLKRMRTSGRVLLTQLITKKGYARVTLCIDGKERPWGVHQLIAITFHGDPPSPGMHACHIDGNPRNNTVENIRWGTPKQNAADQVRHGRHRNERKTHCDRGHAFDAENTRISKTGQRKCRKCEFDYQRERHPLKGMRKGEGVGSSKLTADSVRAMRAMRADGSTYQEIADAFGVTIGTAHPAITGKTWAHVT